jgi:hypothetical protein
MPRTWPVAGCVAGLLLASGDVACVRPAPSPRPSVSVSNAAPPVALPRGLPADFPLPPGHVVESASAGLTSFALALRVPSAAEALAFFREALPRAGWRAREGALRPRGARVPGDETRFVGGLIFTTGTGDEECEGGLDALARPDADRLEIEVPRVGVPPRPGSAAPAPVSPAPAGARPAPLARWDLPDELPWPATITATSVARRGDGLTTAAFTLPGPNGARVWAFYRAELPRAGFGVREVWRPDPAAEVFLGRLAFEGHGRRGRLTLHADAARARVTLRFEPR